MKAYFLLGKTSPPPQLNHELMEATEKIKNKKTPEAALKKAYELIIDRYDGRRFSTFFRLPSLLSRGANDLWNRRGFMHCTNQNYLLYTMLIHSGHFKETDIQPRWSLYWWISPHQYLKIRLSSKEYLFADPWSAKFGIALGDYSHGFHVKSKL